MWRLESEQGRWHTVSFQFQVDLKRPDLGWTDIQLELPTDDGMAMCAIQDVPFQVRFPGDPRQNEEAISDCYVRQADLVATYTQRSDRTVRPQLVWRVLQDDSRVGVETLVSMQTSLLDSAPEAIVTHQLLGELWLVDDHSEQRCQAEQTITLEQEGSSTTLEARPLLVLQRLPNHDVSFVIVGHPADIHCVSLLPQGESWQVQFKLFPESLEKGVIQRTRMRGIYVPRANDIDMARRCFQEMSAAAPPLTT